MIGDGFDEARRLWTRLYLDIPHEEGCFEAGKETDPDEFPLLRAKHLARLVSEEREAAVVERDRLWAEAVLLTKDTDMIEKITTYVIERRTRTPEVPPRG